MQAGACTDGREDLQTMRGDGIDQAVAACFLEAIQPAHLSVSLATLAELETRAKQTGSAVAAPAGTGAV